MFSQMYALCMYVHVYNLLLFRRFNMTVLSPEPKAFRELMIVVTSGAMQPTAMAMLRRKLVGYRRSKSRHLAHIDTGTQCMSKDIALTPPGFLAPEFFARGTPHWTYVGLPPFRSLRLHCTPLRMLCFLCFFIFDRTVLC